MGSRVDPDLSPSVYRRFDHDCVLRADHAETEAGAIGPLVSYQAQLSYERARVHVANAISV